MSDSASEGSSTPPAKTVQSGNLAPAPPSPVASSYILFTDGPDLPTEVGVYGMSLHSGPLPSPQTLAEYKRIDPALPGEILAMAKANAAHIQEMQAKDLQRQIDRERGDRAERRLGQLLGFGVAVLGLSVACILALKRSTDGGLHHQRHNCRRIGGCLYRRANAASTRRRS